MSKARGKTLDSLMTSFDPEPEPAPAVAAARPKTGGTDVVGINVLVSPADRHRLRQLSLDSGLSLQKLGHEAWNMMLRARGLEPLEPTSANVPSGRRRRDD